MGVEGQRFNDGVIDLSSLRAKKEAEAASEEVVFNAEAVLSTVPAGYEAKGPDEEPLRLEVVSAIVHPRGHVFLVMTDNIEGEPPFIMVATHEANKMNDDLRPATEEEFAEFQSIMADYAQDQLEEQDAIDAELDSMLEEAQAELDSMSEKERKEYLKKITDAPPIELTPEAEERLRQAQENYEMERPASEVLDEIKGIMEDSKKEN